MSRKIKEVIDPYQGNYPDQQCLGFGVVFEDGDGWIVPSYGESVFRSNHEEAILSLIRCVVALKEELQKARQYQEDRWASEGYGPEPDEEGYEPLPPINLVDFYKGPGTKP